MMTWHESIVKTLAEVALHLAFCAPRLPDNFRPLRFSRPSQRILLLFAACFQRLRELRARSPIAAVTVRAAARSKSWR